MTAFWEALGLSIFLIGIYLAMIGLDAVIQ